MTSSIHLSSPREQRQIEAALLDQVERNSSELKEVNDRAQEILQAVHESKSTHFRWRTCCIGLGSALFAGAVCTFLFYPKESIPIPISEPSNTQANTQAPSVPEEKGGEGTGMIGIVTTFMICLFVSRFFKKEPAESEAASFISEEEVPLALSQQDAREEEPPATESSSDGAESREDEAAATENSSDEEESNYRAEAEIASVHPRNWLGLRRDGYDVRLADDTCWQTRKAPITWRPGDRVGIVRREDFPYEYKFYNEDNDTYASARPRSPSDEEDYEELDPVDRKEKNCAIQ